MFERHSSAIFTRYEYLYLSHKTTPNHVLEKFRSLNVSDIGSSDFVVISKIKINVA
jgi:hypothetical protein